MANRKKASSTVTDLRNLLFNEVDVLTNGGNDADIKRANSVRNTAATIYQSYKLQMVALKTMGKSEDIKKLKGLVD